MADWKRGVVETGYGELVSWMMRRGSVINYVQSRPPDELSG